MRLRPDLQLARAVVRDAEELADGIGQGDDVEPGDEDRGEEDLRAVEAARPRLARVGRVVEIGLGDVGAEVGDQELGDVATTALGRGVHEGRDDEARLGRCQYRAAGAGAGRDRTAVLDQEPAALSVDRPDSQVCVARESSTAGAADPLGAQTEGAGAAGREPGGVPGRG